MNRTTSAFTPILDSICPPAATVDVLFFLENYSRIVRGSGNLSVSEAKEKSEEILSARTAVGELIEAAKALESITKPDSYREEMRPGDGCTEIIGITEWSDEVTNLRAALARVGGGK